MSFESDPKLASASTSSQRFHHVITRHPGAADWVSQHLGFKVHAISHLEIDAIESGGSYYGVFPLHLAAAICTKGSACWAISVNMPPALRGQELSAQQLDELDARLVRYNVQAIAEQTKSSDA